MKTFNPHSLITVIRQYYSFYYQQKELSEKTKENHSYRVGHIISYLAEIQQPQISIHEIDVDFVQGFMEWSSQYSQLTNYSRDVELLQAVLDYAVTKRIIITNPIKTVITGRSPIKEVISVTSEELNLIYGYEGVKTEELASDLYVLQSETGMSYADLWDFKIIKEDETIWLYNTRMKGIGKNRKDYWVPLSERALEIINRYKGKMPRLTNLVYNTNIKVVAKKLRIKKKLTTHTARKTFATRMYEAGWSLESIADMMGITMSVLTTHYIRKSKNRIANELLKRQSV